MDDHDVDHKFQIDSNDIKNPLLRFIMISNVLTIMIVLLPFIIVPHCILRIFGRKGFIYKIDDEITIVIGPDAFRKNFEN